MELCVKLLKIDRTPTQQYVGFSDIMKRTTSRIIVNLHHILFYYVINIKAHAFSGNYGDHFKRNLFGLIYELSGWIEASLNKIQLVHKMQIHNLTVDKLKATASRKPFRLN